MDLQTENIAELAVRARSIPDVITLWYGEGDLVTPDFIRDAAKALARRRPHLLRPRHARPAGADRGAFRLPHAAARQGHPGGALDRDAGRHAGGVPGARPRRRCRHERRLCRAAMAEHPPAPSRSPAASRAPCRSISRTATGGSTSTSSSPPATRAPARSCSPRRPTRSAGRRAAPSCEALIEFSRRTGIWIISDELYNRLVLRRASARRRCCRSPSRRTSSSASTASPRPGR